MGVREFIAKMSRKSAAAEVERQAGKQTAAKLREKNAPDSTYQAMKGTGTGI